MTLIEQISNEMMNDDADDSERLQALYENADEAGKALLDAAFICVCGYSLGALLEEVQ